MQRHGGDIYSAAEALAGAGGNRELLDFSASINPLGMPESGIVAYRESLSWVAHYPDPEVRELRRAIAAHHGIGIESILCGNGSTELISLVPRALSLRKVAAPSPTFSEYERAVNRAGGEMIPIPLDPAKNFDPAMDELFKGAEQADALFLCNPNNPTGRLLDRETVLKIAEHCSQQKIYFMVDETFGDFCPGHSILKEAAGNPYLLSLRSFTKFYGMPGLRLGYLVAHPSVVGRVRELQDSWSIGVPAQRVGVAVLSDGDYAERTLDLITGEREFLSAELKKTGWLEPVPSSANFLLVRITDPAVTPDMTCEMTAKSGILLRNCRSFPGLDRYVRIAVRSREENKRLLEALQMLTFK
ncbi:MAG: threonine-phosphate decarboxylase CobD [Nitrospirota bacterium]|nr:threonine-phosphate decarboxylase CobD [Nitrospirota bacterium]